MNTIVKSSILHNLARTSLRSRKTVKIFARALSTKPDVANEYKGGYLKVGHWAEKSKQFLDADVQTFSNLSLDTNPVHLSAEYASKTKFGKRIAHGFLSASLISGVAGTILPGPGSIYLSQDLQFKKPVFINDTVTARVKLLALKKRIAEFETNIYNQHGELVIEGKAVVMVPADKIEPSNTSSSN
jgi:acyl dehydratase